MKSRPRLRGLIRGTGIALLLGLGFALGAAGCSPRSDPANGQMAGGAEHGAAPGGPFALRDTKGRRVTDQTLRGRPYAIFFGFTRCPDICPTTMNRMARLHQKLGPEASKLAIVFVSVDPGHDTPETIASFLSMFDVPVIGLSGDAAATERMTRAYRIYVERVPLPNGDYTIDHSAQILLFDRAGHFVATMDSHAPEDQALARLRRLIHG